MKEKKIKPKPLGAHNNRTSEVLPRVETDPNQSDGSCGAKDAIDNAATALEGVGRQSENLGEQSSGDNLATPRDADGRCTANQANRGPISENVVGMLKELDKAVSSVMGSARSFETFVIGSKEGDPDPQKVKRSQEFWDIDTPSEDEGPEDAIVKAIVCRPDGVRKPGKPHNDASEDCAPEDPAAKARRLQEIHRMLEELNREVSSLMGLPQTALLGCDALNTGQRAPTGSEDRSTGYRIPKKLTERSPFELCYSADESAEHPMQTAIITQEMRDRRLKTLRNKVWLSFGSSLTSLERRGTEKATKEVNRSSASWEPPSFSGCSRATAVAKRAAAMSGAVDRESETLTEQSSLAASEPPSIISGEVDRGANNKSEMSSLAASEPPSYSEDESAEDPLKTAAIISGEVDRDANNKSEMSSLAAYQPTSCSEDRSCDKTKMGATISEEVDGDPKETDMSSVASYLEHDTYINSSASSQPGSDFEGENRPKLLDPRSVPGIQNLPEQSDTYFKLHHNGPFFHAGGNGSGEQTPLLLAEQEDEEESQQEKHEQDEKALSQTSDNEQLFAATEGEDSAAGVAEVAEAYDPEFPALNSSTERLSGSSLQKLDDMATENLVRRWLYSQTLLSDESRQWTMEALPKNSLMSYDDEDDEDESQQKPNEAEDKPDEEDKTLLQLNEAIPECCLSDAVFLVDKPTDAVSLGFRLPPLSLEQGCEVGAFIKIHVTHVYTPFQFWFNLQPEGGAGSLAEMEREMSTFYNDRNPDYLNVLPSCLLKLGYMCAIKTQATATWRRARILGAPPPDADAVSIYYVDYGSHASVSAGDLRYLSTHFGERPPLAVRGTLSYVHPTDTHWTPDSTQQFRRLVSDKELFAHITEVDLVEGIVFMRLSRNQEFQPSINKVLVDARLAGRSRHYDPQYIEKNLGRRQRYLRERLPTHEMLETGVFPVLGDEFEVEFDGIIYSPAFGRYEVPKVKAPYGALREALVAWMPAYRRETEHWCRLYEEERIKRMEAQRKIREDWLAELETIRSTTDRVSEIVEKVKAMAPDQVDKSSGDEQLNQEEGTRREGDMDMVD